MRISWKAAGKQDLKAALQVSTRVPLSREKCEILKTARRHETRWMYTAYSRTIENEMPRSGSSQLHRMLASSVDWVERESIAYIET